MATVDDLLNAARSELGYVESPRNSNLTKFAAEAGHVNGQPWCATFEVALAHRVGLTLPSGCTTASVFQNLAAYQQHDASPLVPQPGDFAHFNIGQGHTGIVVSVQYATITTVDGNTIPEGETGDQANGGEVCLKTRSKLIVAGYGRPTYSAPATPSIPPSPLGAHLMNVGPRTVSRILHTLHWGHEPTAKDLDIYHYAMGVAATDEATDAVVASIFDRESK